MPRSTSPVPFLDPEKLRIGISGSMDSSRSKTSSFIRSDAAACVLVANGCLSGANIQEAAQYIYEDGVAIFGRTRKPPPLTIVASIFSTRSSDRHLPARR